MNLDADYIARWNGDSWSALGTMPLGDTVASLAVNGLNLYVGGNFDNAGGDANADKIALFQLDGTPPTINDFSTAPYYTSLEIPIGTFSASDNVGVTGYKITESATPHC